MPALLAEKDYDAWLGGAAGMDLLKPAADDLLEWWPVSKHSSKAPADDPTLIDQVTL
jgi:putative SOS response-associated peptidase YedK